MRLALFALFGFAAAQYTSQTYPDPRLDPITCRLPLSSQVCDPSSILSDEERIRLMQRLNQIFVIVIDKIGSIPGAAVDIEKFANNLKRRFQNYQDVSACDTTVLIVNSKQDRQVFTVAGRDARISKEMLKNAFERNIGYFKAGNYAMGLEGMIEIVVATYSNAHIMQVPTPEPFNQQAFIGTPSPIKLMPDFHSTAETVAPFRAAGLPNSVQPAKTFASLDIDDVDENDKVWVTIMQQAVARCGSQPEMLPVHVRAVVEEAMSISLKLISDSRYNSIEEEVDAHKDVIGIRERAWESATTKFIRPLFQKYHVAILKSSRRTCPAVTFRHLQRRRL